MKSEGKCLLHHILEPINELSLCGTDYKYEDAYLAIEAEIDKSSSLLEDVKTDWSKVAVETEALLGKQTKDVKLMCWWVYASYKQQSLQGLEEAILIFNDFLATFKEELFPKSKKVKLSSIEWLEELLNAIFLDDRGDVTVTIDAAKFLNYFTSLEKNFSLVIQEEKPVFKKLQRSLEKLSEMEKPPVPKETVVNTTVKPTNTQFVNQEQCTEITSPADALIVLRSLKKNATLLHEYYRQHNSSDIMAIRLVRLISWLEINDVPQAQDGKTLINPPSAESIDKIEELIAEKEYDQALDRVENLISRSPFWIEGHFITFTILTELGYNNTANEVKNALLGFVKQNPEILEFSFRDTTPFASVKLKKWLVEDREETISKEIKQDSYDDKMEQIIENAYALAKKKHIKEAMKLLQKQYIGSVTKEDKFRWHLVKAELAVEFGKKDVALALLDDLKKDIDTHGLDEWNPELTAKVFSLFLGFDRTQVNIEDITATYARLCKVDIEKALEIKL